MSDWFNFDGICPDCHKTRFLKGPDAAECQNIECEHCGANFNVGPFGAQRIGWNRSGRWVRRSELPVTSDNRRPGIGEGL